MLALEILNTKKQPHEIPTRQLRIRVKHGLIGVFSNLFIQHAMETENLNRVSMNLHSTHRARPIIYSHHVNYK
jgi:hypothetical protein